MTKTRDIDVSRPTPPALSNPQQSMRLLPTIWIFGYMGICNMVKSRYMGQKR